MNAILARRRQLLQSLPKSDPVLRVLPVSTSNGGWWFGRRNYFLNAILEEVGAINPARDMTYNGIAGAEEILRLDPDMIVMPNGIDPALPQQIFADPQWQALRAVKARRIYLLPRGSLFNLVVEDALWPIWLAELLHPSIPHQIRAAYRELYAQAYNRALSEDEIDEALDLSQNAGSFGYDRFTREAPPHAEEAAQQPSRSMGK